MVIQDTEIRDRNSHHPLSYSLSRPEVEVDCGLCVIILNGFPSLMTSPTYVKMQEVINEAGIATLRFDYSGFGDSEGDVREFDIDVAVSNLSSVVEYLKTQGFERFALAGYSFGGMVGLIYASSNEVEFLVLKSPVVNYFEQKKLLNKLDQLEKWKKENWLREDRFGNTYEIPYSYAEKLMSYDGYELGKKIKCPTLLIHGAKDETIPVEQSKKLGKIIPNCKVEILPNADHHYSSKSIDSMQLRLIKAFCSENVGKLVAANSK